MDKVQLIVGSVYETSFNVSEFSLFDLDFETLVFTLRLYECGIYIIEFIFIDK